MDDQYASAYESFENTPEVRKIEFEPIDYQTETKKRAEQAASSALDRQNREVWSTICNHWDVSDHDGNLSLVRSFCGGEITVEKFQLMLDTPGEAESLDWKGTRDRIIAEIADLLEDKTGRRLSDYAFREAVKNMRFWHKAKLRARLAELRFKQGKSANDARDLLEQHRAAERAQQPYYPFENIPASITSDHIKNAPRDRRSYLYQRYGQQQVTKRLES